MRFVVRVTMPTEKGNKAVQDGSIGRIMQQQMERWKPEGAYFTTMDGYRTAIMIVDLPDTSSMVPFAEPLFMGLDAKVEYFPAMNPGDLQTGLSKVGR
jgi:hypothetical protein